MGKDFVFLNMTQNPESIKGNTGTYVITKLKFSAFLRQSKTSAI